MATAASTKTTRKPAARKTALTRSAASPSPALVAVKDAPKGVTRAQIKWTPEGEKDDKGNRPATGVSGDRTYAITGSGAEWQATVTVAGKVEVLGEKVGSKRAWQLCVNHNRAV